jgi:hypothetical protein
MVKLQFFVVILLVIFGLARADDSSESVSEETSAANDYPKCHKKNLQWFPHQLNCSLYFLCHHGNAVQRSCAPGLFFNNDSGQCMVPELANCQLTCPAKDDPQNPLFLEDMNDCSRFYICYNGNAIHRECAEGLLFDSENNWCDFDFNVDCGYRGGGDGGVLPPVPTPSPIDPITTTEDPATPRPSPTPTTTTTERATTTSINVDKFVSQLLISKFIKQ